MILQSINASASPEVQMNENFETLEFSAVYGKRQPVTTGLTWGYYGGRWSGFAITENTLTLTNAATNYIVVARATGVISVSTSSTNWDNVTDYARVYKVVTSGGVVSGTPEDHRAGQYGIFAPAQPSVNTTAVGNVGTGEDDLMTFAMPASTLNAAKKGVRITAWGSGANNANSKTLKMYFGSTAILTAALTVSQACAWRIVAEVFSTGTDAQDYCAQFLQAGTATLIDIEQGTSAQDDGAAITIKCTGDATTDDDVKQEGMIIEYLG